MEVTNPVVATVPAAASAGGAGGDPAATTGGRTRGGRGLRGIRERVTVLRGDMSAGVDDGRWRLAVRLPLRSPR
jgi:glucose-6-phosphate-specific signal transduction histidine kinase